MHCLVLSVSFALFVFTKASKPRSVNLALETVLEFDKATDVDIIKQVQQFLNKIKDSIDDDSEHKDVPTRRNQRYQFTDFLQDFIVTLNSFKNDDLKRVIQIMDSEIQTMNVDDLLQKDIRRYLSDNLKNINVKSPNNIRKSLDEILRKLNSPTKDKHSYLLGFINTLYKKDSEAKLAKFISRLKIFRRSTVKEKKIQEAIKRAVKTIIFDHVSNLSKLTKSKIEAWINDLSENKKIMKKNQQVKIKSEIELHSRDTERSFDNSDISNEEKVVNDSKSKKIRNRNELFTMNKQKNDFRLHTKQKLTNITLYPEYTEAERRPYKNRFRVADSAPFVKENQDKSKDIIETKKKSTIELTSLSHSVEIDVNLLKNNENQHAFRNKEATSTENKDFSVKTTDGNNTDTMHSISETRKLHHSKIKRKDKNSIKYFGNLYKNPRYNSKDAIKRSFSNIIGEKNREEYKIENENTSNKNKNNSNKNYTIRGQNFTSKERENNKRTKSKNMPKLSKAKYNLINTASNRRQYDTRHMGEREKSNITDNILNSIDIASNASRYYAQNTLQTTNTDNLFDNPTTDAMHNTNNTKFHGKIMERDLNEISNDITNGELKNKSNLTKLQSYITRELITNTEVTNTATKMETLVNTVLKGQNTERNAINVTKAIPLDINNLIKNYQIQDIEDVEKKKEIEKKIKEDLKNILSSSMTSVTVTTTESFTDIFKDLEEEFQLN